MPCADGRPGACGSVSTSRRHAMSAKETKKKVLTKKGTGDTQVHRKATGEIKRAAAKAEKPKPLMQRDALAAPVPETCPRGGEHERTDEGCNKCLEPKPQSVAS